LDQGADNRDWIARAPQAHPKTEPFNRLYRIERWDSATSRRRAGERTGALRKPALTLLVGAALEHFLLVPGNIGIYHICLIR
jgi:hypothetical protein